MLTEQLVPAALPALLHGSLGSWDELIVVAIGLVLGAAVFALGGKRGKTGPGEDGQT